MSNNPDESTSDLLRQLEDYEPTKSLRAAGLTEKDFLKIRVSSRHSHRPFNEWSFTWPEHLTPLMHLFSQMRAFAALRYACIDGPAENGPEISAAWQAYADTVVVEPAVAARWRLSLTNKNNAQKPRGYIPEFGMKIRELVMSYAQKPENQSLKASEIWCGFGQEMRWHGVDSELVGDTYEYLGATLKYETFRNYVRDGRNLKSH